MERTRAGVLLALALGLAAGSARAAPRMPLRWKVERNDFVHYQAKHVDIQDSDGQRDTQRGRPTDLHGFYGYELVEGLRVMRPLSRAGWLRTPFLYRLPGPKLDPQARVTIDETLPQTTQLEAVRARGHLRVVEVRDERFVRLRGTVLFGPAERDPHSARSWRVIGRGRLHWSATFDTQRGLMTAITYDLDLASGRSGLPPPRGVSNLRQGDRTLRVRATLALDRRYEHRYRGFQRDVDRALERGCAYVEKLQRRDGTFPGNGSWGTTGLAVLALVRSGRPPASAAVAHALPRLLAQEPRGTYETASVIMALEALGTPPEELLAARRGELAPPLARTLTPAAAKQLRACAAYLLANIQRGPRPAKTVTGQSEHVRWGYPFDYELNLEPEHPDWWDNSNTQYAVLGLNSAARCGFKVPRAIWAGVAEHLLAVQAPSGPPLERLRLQPHPRRGRDAGAQRYAAKAVDAQRRGWSYRECGQAGHAYGSMTTAGIASLSIARAHLVGPKRSRRFRQLRTRIDAALRDGWAALFGMWTPAENPRYAGWHYYHLYGLERAGILADVERVQGHDWYWEGAVQLLLRQQADGSWPLQGSPPHDTLWALLFLSRSTTPITPR